MIRGVGLGLRWPHISQVLTERPPIPWFELLADNYLREGGQDLVWLDKIREHYPMTFHCVGMNLGGTAPLDFEYLSKMKALALRYSACWISDHLSWSAHQGKFHHDLLPLPYTKEAISNTVERILRVQDFLGERILIENASTYIQFKNSEMPEWEFLCEVSDRADCFILLDINNIYVNSQNHHFDPAQYLNNMPKDRVKEFHLAGHERDGSLLLDTHGAPVIDEVWNLLNASMEIFGPIPTMIERDNNVPPLADLILEVQKAEHMVSLWS
ncbi:MAG: DUF692 domain-containing protein [Bdellovibrionales bacterium]|nr:DUF692 domain-containing protein [Bdellovibrionales bacterium]